MNAANGTAYDGRTMLHCHILEHEDQGAMGFMDVIGGTPPPTYPAGTNYSEYYALNGASLCGNGVCDLGESCTSCASDCASVTSGRPSKQYCCGDGVAQTAEGDGSICNGNY